jgi:hypothetical protein
MNERINTSVLIETTKDSTHEVDFPVDVDVEVCRSWFLLQARTSGESLEQGGWCLYGISQKRKCSQIWRILYSQIELKSGGYGGDWGLCPE